MLVALHGRFAISIEQLELVPTFSVVTYEPREFEKEPVQIQDFIKITLPFR